jgi:hypothetical protein
MQGNAWNRMVAVNMFNETLDILENKYNEEVGCLMKTKHKNLVCFLGSRTRGIIVDYEGKFVMTDVFQYIYLIRALISIHVYVALNMYLHLYFHDQIMIRSSTPKIILGYLMCLIYTTI